MSKISNSSFIKPCHVASYLGKHKASQARMDI